MIISPPFLIPSAALDQETQSLPPGDTVPPPHECAPGNGAFPVSFNLGWHGGPHLMAPKQARDPKQYEPVRVIADGTVVFVRKNSPAQKDPAKDPLQYAEVRTDDGCVVIQHDTEIGENAAITWFSIYLHLQKLNNPHPTQAHPDTSQPYVGQKVYRKDFLGTPGMVYGQPGQIHFEQVCDTANLKKMIGRAPGPLGNAQPRTDAVYGDIWFHVPAGQPLFQNEPHPFRDHDENPPVGTHPSAQPQPRQATTAGEYVIQMHYAGDCTMTTYHKNEADGTWAAVGSQVEQDGEYNLYHKASILNAKYTDGSLMVCVEAVPSPSVIFEMRRFGRLLQQQMPRGAEFNHWRQVNTPDGTGWINLSASEGITAYSDADFPDWAGWSFIQDDKSQTSHCDSATIKKWLTDAVRPQGGATGGASAPPANLTHADLVQALHNDAVKKRMAKAICQFPTEWAKADPDDKRYAWLKQSSEAWTTPLSETDFAALMNHANALAFWEEAQTHAPTLPKQGDVWHFPATEFFRQFRKCFWLSADELKRVYPDTYTRKVGTHIESAPHALDDGTRERYRVILNRLTEKHFVTKNAYRMSHFYGQGAEESRTLTQMNEHRSEASCNAMYQNKNGNDLPGDGYRYRGRGMKQLTGKANYSEYWVYRGWLNRSDFTDSWWSYSETYEQAQPHPKHALHLNHPVVDPNIDNPDRLLTDPYNTIDAGAWYWEATPNHGAPHDHSSINMGADRGIDVGNIRYVTEQINGGHYGEDNREYHTQLIYAIVGDEP